MRGSCKRKPWGVGQCVEKLSMKKFQKHLGGLKEELK